MILIIQFSEKCDILESNEVGFIGRKQRGEVMRKLLKKNLSPLKEALDELEVFVRRMDQAEYAYFYRQVERMKNNADICTVVPHVDWEQLEEILIRDWNLIKQMYDCLWKLELETGMERYRFLQLLTLIEWYLDVDEKNDMFEYSTYVFYN